jgi:hypothetical protein
MSAEQLAAVRAQFIEMISRAVVTAVQGFFNPFSGTGLFQLSGLFGGSVSPATLIALFTNAIPGLSGMAGLGSIFTDITSVLGNPTNLGSGTPGLPAPTSIPLLGGLLSAGGGTQVGLPFIPNLPLGQILGLLTGWLSIFPTAILNNNGTATPSPSTSSITINNNGTASYLTDAQFPLSINNNGTATIPITPIAVSPQSLPDIRLQHSTDLQSAVDSLWTGITGLNGFGANNSQMGAAVLSQSGALAGQAAQIAQLQAAFSTGTTDSDAFERITTVDPGSAWSMFYSTAGVTVAIPDGHNLTVKSSTTGDYVGFRNGVTASTDDQTVSCIFNGAAGSSPILIPINFGFNDLWIRMNTFTSWATRTGVRLRLKANGAWSLDYFINGVGTNLTSGTTSTAVAGKSFTFFAKGRAFTGQLDGVGFMNGYLEPGTGSQMGPTYRRRGLGGRCEQQFLANCPPGGLRQWTASG